MHEGTPSIYLAWAEFFETEAFGPLPRLREVLKTRLSLH